MKEILNKTATLVLTATAGVVLYMLIVTPLRGRLKFSFFITSRLGHYAFDFFSDVFYNKISSKDLTYYYISKPTCNSYIDSMAARCLNTSLLAKYFLYAAMYLPYLRSFYKPPRAKTKKGSRDLSNIFHANPSLGPTFLDHERLESIEYLKKKGWKPGQPLVCLQVRDSSYLKSSPLTDSSIMNEEYHKYRDSNASNYIPSILWLIAEHNAFVVRIGRVAEYKLDINSPSFVDYPFEIDQKDLVDIWLLANCDLLLSTGSGPDAVSQAYNKPIIFTNFSPISIHSTYSNCYCASKKYFWKSSMKHFSMDDYFLNTFYDSNEYFKQGISYDELDEGEILEIVKEGWKILIDGETPSIQDLTITTKYQKLVTRSEEKEVNCIKNRMYISSLVHKLEYENS